MAKVDAIGSRHVQIGSAYYVIRVATRYGGALRGPPLPFSITVAHVMN